MHKFIRECPCDQYLEVGGGSLTGKREELICERGNRDFSLSDRESWNRNGPVVKARQPALWNFALPSHCMQLSPRERDDLG